MHCARPAATQARNSCHDGIIEKDLPNEILAMATKSRMLEKSWDELVILDFINVFLLKRTFALSRNCVSSRFIALVAIGVIRAGGRCRRASSRASSRRFFVLFVHGHDEEK